IRLPAGGKARLRATAADHLPSAPREPPSPGEDDAPFVLKLEPAGTIVGRVVDAADHPLARVQITALPAQVDKLSTFSTAWSRADGRIRLSRLSPGTLYEVMAAQEGFAPASTKAGALSRDRPPAAVRVVLERGATVFGRVLDRAGNPVRSAGLSLDPPLEIGGWGDGHIIDFQGPVSQATSDAKGSFAFQHLNPGRFRLRVKRKGFAPFALPEIEVQRSARVDLGVLTLDPGLVIEGRVTDPRGAPVPGIDVQLSPSVLVLGSEDPRFMREPTDAEGRFRFDDLRRGERFDLHLAPPGYLPVNVRSLEVPAPEPLMIELKR